LNARGKGRDFNYSREAEEYPIRVKLSRKRYTGERDLSGRGEVMVGARVS